MPFDDQITEFLIPHNLQDLRRSALITAYYVQDVLSKGELQPALKASQTALEREGVESILQHFDVYYSILVQFDKLEMTVKEQAWNKLIKLGDKLDVYLKNTALSELDSTSRKVTQMVTKMICYLLCEMVEAWQKEAAHPGKDLSCNKKQKKKENRSSSWDWEFEATQVISILQNLFQYPLQHLWEPPVVEEEFTNMVTNCCYKSLENPTLAKNKNFRDQILEVIGPAISKFNHALGSAIKIVQLLKYFDHLASPMASVAVSLTNTYDEKLLNMIFVEISQMNFEELEKENIGVKNICQFLLEVTESLPHLALKSISLLVPYLDEDPYSIRNCVLSMFGNIIVNALSGELNEREKKIRDQILKKLLNHLHDVNAFVRSKTLQIWQNLCSQKAITLSIQKKLIKLAIGRLNDKSSIVRKNAILFVTELLQSNPYAANLQVGELMNKLEVEKAALKELDPTFNPDDMEHSSDESDLEDLLEEKTAVDKTVALTEEEASETMGNEPDIAVVDAINKQKNKVKYLCDTIQFAQQNQAALPTIASFLKSKTLTDVIEAIKFFVAAYQFGVKDAIMGVREILIQIESKDKAIKEAVIAAYKTLYFHSTKQEPFDKALEVINNLSVIIKGASLGELACLETLISEIIKELDMKGVFIQVLWDMFTLKIDNTTQEQQRNALILITMAAKTSPQVVHSKLDKLVSFGLNDQAHSDFDWAKLVLNALLTLEPLTKSSTESLTTPFRLKKDHAVFKKLEDIIMAGITITKDTSYIPMVDRAFKFIYKLNPCPDSFSRVIVEKIIGILNFENAEFNSTELSRFIFIIGHIALLEAIYLEIDIYTELKRRQNIKDCGGKNPRKTRMSIMNSPCRQASMNKSMVDAAAEELGLEGATAEDPEGEQIRDICDNFIVAGNSIVGPFIPIILEVLSDPEKFGDRELQSAAFLSLAKIMMVSEVFCKKHISTFVGVMNSSLDPTVRSNGVVSLSDFSLRFPNLTEPWTPHIYARIKDESTMVQKSALTVLSYLILHDRIKVKGQISEVALCIIHPNDEISSLAKFLFTELAKKENVIYNILPDIISTLSDPEKGTSEENFKVVTKFIVPLISKNQHVENMIEKLCQKFGATTSERQWEDLSYCLTLLPINEKCIYKIQQNIECFINKFTNEKVAENFYAVLGEAKKSTNFKPDVKEMVEELEKAFREMNAKGITDKKTQENKENIRKKKKTEGKKPRGRQAAKNLSDDDEEDADFTKAAPRVVRTRRTAPSINKRKVQELFSSDSD